jgi:hypothetical protein
MPVYTRSSGNRKCCFVPSPESADVWSMTIERHLAVRHKVWRFNDAPPHAPQTYGSTVSEANLHVIHAKLHERDPESDHPYAFGG